MTDILFKIDRFVMYMFCVSNPNLLSRVSIKGDLSRSYNACLSELTLACKPYHAQSLQIWRILLCVITAPDDCKA